MIPEYNPEESPYSFGTTPIYNSMFKILTDMNDMTDVIAINLSVIVRNVATKTNIQEEYKVAKDKALPFNVVSEDIVRESDKEIKLLVSDIVQMYNNKKSSLPRYIFLYTSNLSKVIPNEYLKPVPPSKLHVDMADETVRKHLGSKRSEYESDGIKIVELYTDSRTALYHILEREIRGLRNHHNVVMVTNHPIDYHIFKYVGEWRNIKSFTGQVQTKDDLGEKVFGYNFLPFTEKLHVLLGDKYDLKQTITQKAKKELLEVAERDSWNLKSNDYTDRALRSLNYLPPYVI